MAKPKDTPPTPDVSSATESTLYSPEFQTPSPASNIDEPTKYHDAPEVVPGSSLPDFSYNSSRHDTAKQVAYGEDPEVDHSARDDTSKHIIIGGGDLEVAVGKGLEVVVESEEQKTNAEGPEKTILPIAWWKQKRVWIPAAVAFVLIIGLAVGLGVGLSQSR
jgi:hypothetical protein